MVCRPTSLGAISPTHHPMLIVNVEQVGLELQSHWSSQEEAMPAIPAQGSGTKFKFCTWNQAHPRKVPGPSPPSGFFMLSERAQYMLASPAPKKQRTSCSSLHHPWDKALRSANGAPSKYGFLLPLSPPGPVLQSYSFSYCPEWELSKNTGPVQKQMTEGHTQVQLL